MGSIDNKRNITPLCIFKDNLITNKTYQKQLITYLESVYSNIPTTTKYDDLRNYLNNFINKTRLLSELMEDIIIELTKHIT